MVLSHIDIESSGSWNLLHRALRTRRTPEVLQPSDDFEHRCQGHAACILPQTPMWTHTVVDV